MKTFRWFTAGAAVLFLAVLVFWRSSPPSTRRPSVATHIPSQTAAPSAAAPAVTRNTSVAPLANTTSSQPTITRAAVTPSIALFEEWAREFATAPAAQRNALLGRGEELANARREAMVQLIKTNPEEAIARSLSYSLRKQLPENILALIEQPLNTRGDFRPLIYEPLPGREADCPPNGFEVTVGKTKFQTFTYGERLHSPGHESIYLNGVHAGNVLALSSRATRPVKDRAELSDLAKAGKVKLGGKCITCNQPIVEANSSVVQFGDDYYAFCDVSHAMDFDDQVTAAHQVFWASGAIDGNPSDQLPPTAQGPTQGLKKLLYVRVNYIDDPTIPQSDDQAAATAQNNNLYYTAGSYGIVWWETTVTPVIKLPQRKVFYGENPNALLNDASAGAAALGYFSFEYFMMYVLTGNQPQYLYGGLSSGILNASPGAITHELGHNFGLPHANFWQPEGSAPGPTNNTPFPTDPDSLIGHNDLNAPVGRGSPPKFLGDSSAQPMWEYGNFNDVMGSGGSHFSTMFKRSMNWLPEKFIERPSASTTNRIYAFDVPSIVDGRTYAMVLHKNPSISYWLSYRQAGNNRWFNNGLEITSSRGGDNELIDTTPDSTYGRADGALVAGRTLYDSEANLYITPIAVNHDANPTNSYIDVVVQIGDFTENTAPTLSIAADTLTLTNGGTVNLTSVAQDADGNALAYFWDFGDYTFGTNGPVQSKTYATAGNYVVRCEVSDMKGGVASRVLLVTVGNPTTLAVSGRVLDPDGIGVQGVRVHNGEDKPTDNGNISNIGDYRYSYSDSDGYYIIGNIPPGSYKMRGYKYGYQTVPQSPNEPLSLVDGNASGIDFMATPITRVWIADHTDAFEPGPSGGEPEDEGMFTVRRAGTFDALAQDLPVRFQLIGDARVNTDYTLVSDDATIVQDQGKFIIPAYLDEVHLRVVPNDNGIGDGDHKAGLYLLLATNDIQLLTVLTNVLTTNGSVITTNTEIVVRTNNLSIPGWVLRPSGPSQARTWFQTDPTYVLGLAEDFVSIIDDDPPAIPNVFVTTLDTDAVESRGDTATLQFTRSGAPIDEALTVYYGLSGIASNGVDYVELSGRITIPAGQASTFLFIQAINDLFVEGNEQGSLTILADPQGSYNVSSGFASFMIVDDDLPLVNIFAADSIALRGGSGGRITISRAGTLTDPLTVNYLVTGSAVPGVDYNALQGSVTLAAGQQAIDVPISAIASSTNALPRTVTVQISDATTYNIFNQNSATVTLINGALPTVTITGGADFSEAGGSTTFTVNRTGPTTNSLSVFFDVGGTAWEGVDYSAVGTNVVIPVGAASASITVNGINDSAHEDGDTTGNETLIIQLRTNVNYIVGGTSSRSVRITDDEGDTALPAVGFMLGTSSVREDAGSATIYLRITANPATNKPVEVEYRVIGGTAVPGINYINNFGNGSTGVLDFIHYKKPTPASIIYDIESGIASIQVPILNDGISGGNKTVTLTLMNPSGYVTNVSYVTNNGTTFSNNVITHVPTNAFLGPSVTHTLTILDVGTSVVSVSAPTNLAYEAGATPVRFTVTRSGATNVPLTVGFVVTGTAANGSDFILSTNQFVTIPAGTNSAVVTLTPRDDPAEEMAESFTLTLLSRNGYAVGFPSSATIVLVSDDGTIQFLLTDYRVNEGAGVASIPVVRSGNTNIAVTVSFVASNGTATAGSDYIATNGTLSFAPGETVKNFDIVLVNDTQVEPDETVALALFNPSGGVPLGGQKTATLTIANDDTDIAFSQVSYRGNENALFADIEIVRGGVLTATQFVTFVATNGTAGANDFISTNFDVEFDPDQTNAIVSIDLLDDNLLEGDETVLLRLLNPTDGAALGAISNSTLVIVDDECRIEFESTNYFAREYSGSVTLTLRRNGGTVNPVSVSYTTADGTALSGVDFGSGTFTVQFTGDHYELDTNGTGQLTFVPGESTKTITIPIIDDAIGEGNEDFIVTLSDPQSLDATEPDSVLLGNNVTASVTIIDNETPGNVDYEFVSSPNGLVRALALQYDNKIVIAGDFTLLDGFAFSRVARLQPNGVFDAGFNPGSGANGSVYSLASAPDGKVYLGGDFTQVNNTNRTRIARLAGDGKLDITFSNSANGIVRAIALQTNGQVIIAGDFTTVGGAARSRIARLNADGSLDTGFNPNFNGTVNALAIQPDGKILVGGAFSTVNGASRASLARLSTNGVSDASFAIGAGFNGPVNAIGLQPDGYIVAGGTFTSFDGSGRNDLVRLTPAGGIDTGFVIGGGANGAVNAIGIGTGGKIVIAGDFTTYNGVLANRFARLKKSGGMDFGFVTGNGANASVRAAVVQPDSAIVIGGDFTQVNGIARNYVARIHGDEKAVTTTVELAAVNYSVQENAGPVAVTIARSGNTNSAFSLSFGTYDLSATNGADYAGITNTVSFAAGQTSAVVNVEIINDTAVEGDETFGVFIAGAPTAIDLSGNTNAVVLIEDDEKGIQFGRTNYVVSEDVVTAVVTVQRVGGLSGTISATLVTSDGTANAPSDYLGVSTNISFAPGQTNANVFIPIIDDPAGEPNEFLNLSLINPVGCQIGTPATSILTIADNDFTVGTIVVSNTAPILVLDAQPASPYPSSIVVNNLTGLLSRVEVQLIGLRHAYPSDIDALLVGPAGEKVLLMSDAGGSFPVTNLTLTFDDTAATSLASNAVLTTSTNRPTDYGPADTFFSPAPAGPYGNSLSVFGGKSVNGTWSLYIVDDRGNDAGVISNGWRLIFHTVDPAKVADVSVTGSVSPSSGASAGDVLLYSFIVSNAGPNSAANVMFSNTVPVGATVLGMAPSQGSCDVSNGVVLCALDFLPSGGVATVDFKAIAGIGGVLTNIAVVSSKEPDSIITNNTATIVSTVAAGTTADLNVTLTDSPDPAYAGQPVTYHFVVTNRGPLAATGVVATNFIPANGRFISANVSRGTFQDFGDRLVFNIGAMAANTSVSGDIVVAGRVESIMTNTIFVAANELDLTPENSAVQLTTVSAASDLAVTTSESRDPAGVNVNVTYTITVFNQGPSDAHSVTLFDSLPPQFTLVSYTGSQGSSNATGGTLVFNFGTIAKDNFAQAIIVFRTTVGGTFTNLATAVGLEPEPTPANNTSIESTTVSIDAGGSTVNGIIDNGVIQLGVNRAGHLNVPGGKPSLSGTTAVGLRYLPTGAESTAPGCLCEGWGVADTISGLSGGANESTDGGPFGLVVESFTSDGVNAKSVVRVNGSRRFEGGPTPRQTFRVTHFYHPSPATPNLYQVDVTIENISTNVTEVLYRRVMDWDIEPTPFREYSTVIKGDSTNLIYTSDNGFASADPLLNGFYIFATNTFVDSGPADHGALFDFNFGRLNPGESTSFITYYGAAETERAALSAVARVGAEAYSFGKSSFGEPDSFEGKTNGSPNTFIFGFGGIGGTALAGSDLRLLNTTPSPFAAIGAIYTYTVVVSNAGPDIATNVVMLDTPPANANLANYSTTRGSVGLTNGVLTANIGTLFAGSSATILIQVIPTQEGSLTNGASVTTDQIDFNLANNVATNIAAAVSAGTYANPSPVTVLDAGPAGTYPSIITVLSAPNAMFNLSVTLSDLRHTYPSDLDILLVGPRGQTVMLMSDAGGGVDLDGVTLTLSDASTNSLAASGPIVSGNYKPTNFGTSDFFFAPAPAGPYGTTLSVFNGTDPNGDWKLFIMDDQGSDVGLLAGGWRMNFTASSLVKMFVSVSGSNITLSWSSSATGYYAETAPSVTGPWSPVLGAPELVNGIYTLTVPNSGQRQFFRLKKP